MKRFHVHIAVDDLDASIRFYSSLFGQSPSKQRSDYAKWMLEDPRLNFAISARGHTAGVNHFGMQADTMEELEQLRKQAEDAVTGEVLDQGETGCCYANSVKHWSIDPQGLAWEHFVTMSDAEVFGADQATPTAACCIPLHAAEAELATTGAACCVPRDTAAGNSGCCGQGDRS